MVDLKEILSKGKRKSGKLYWSLIIEPGWVQAGIWGVVDGKAEVLSSSIPTAWELDGELIDVVDSVVSSVLQKLPKGIKEPKETVFAVVSSWVSQGQIKGKYLERIKNICSNLALEPAGFVVLSEAVSHMANAQEGSPLSGVVLGFEKQNIEMTVFRKGSVAGTTQVSRSVSVVEDVSEGLSRLSDSEEPFPSRFIMFDGKEADLEESRQSLIKADWELVKGVNFLHQPKVEILSSQEKMGAVCLAGASEIADVSSLKKSGKEEEEETTPGESDLDNLSAGAEDVSAEELGFVLGEDIKKAKAVPEDKGKPQDISETAKAGEEEKVKTEIPQKREEAVTKGRSLQGLRGFPLKLTSGFGVTVKSMAAKLKPILNLGLGKGKRAFAVGGGMFVALIVAALLFWWFYPKATITVYVSTKKLQENVDLTLDPDTNEADLSGNTLPGEVLTTTQTTDKTKSTSGSKTVGERATGEVTFYRVGPQVILDSGTLLYGPSDLKFTLNDDTTIASGSASTPGTTNAQVTAEDIGAQYNLASGTSFSVGNYSINDIEAKNDNSFSGGSSRQISAVSEEDQEVLIEELEEELESKGKQELIDKLDESFVLIEESLEATTSSRVFSNKVGDEASNLKLTLTREISAVSVSKDLLTQYSRDKLEDKVPEGFVLRSEQIEVDFDFNGRTASGYSLDARITANLLPNIDPDGLAEEIAGKYPEIAQDYLNGNVPSFVRAQVNLNPRLPGKLGTLPRLVKNIEVEIAAEK
ncbi:MAG: baseplate J/gp47 family protein [Candidatus Woesebacteria bacterium]|jgi:hypothetical protein